MICLTLVPVCRAPCQVGLCFGKELVDWGVLGCAAGPSELGRDFSFSASFIDFTYIYIYIYIF